jgi:hypothetical protein
MPKILDQPLLVVAPQFADQLQISSYTVDAQTLAVTLNLAASRDDGNGGRVELPFPPKVLDGVASGIAMGAAAMQIIHGALLASGIGEAIANQIEAALTPEFARGLYYTATRDHLYEAI